MWSFMHLILLILANTIKEETFELAVNFLKQEIAKMPRYWNIDSSFTSR